MSEFKPAPIPTGIVEVHGRDYMTDARGNLTPMENIKPQHKLEDQTVRLIAGYFIAASEQLARLKEHTFEDIGAFVATLAEEYDVSFGGKKGNMTLRTIDGLYEVQVQVQDRLDFGPELQVAKVQIDECLNEWSADAHPAIRSIVTRAFNTDKAGKINMSEIFMLLRQDIDDPRWRRAMEAVRDAMRVVGSATYVRCYTRESHDAPRKGVILDMAKV